MAIDAIAVLSAAQEQAETEPIELTPAMRLALAWLLWDGIAEPWQAKLFAEAVTEPGTGGMAPYCRKRDMAIYLNAWSRVISERDERMGDR